MTDWHCNNQLPFMDSNQPRAVTPQPPQGGRGGGGNGFSAILAVFLSFIAIFVMVLSNYEYSTTTALFFTAPLTTITSPSQSLFDFIYFNSVCFAMVLFLLFNDWIDASSLYSSKLRNIFTSKSLLWIQVSFISLWKVLV